MKMKAAMMMFLMIFVLTATAAHAEKKIKIDDVKPGDWEYESVKYLVDKGYLALYDDGEFKGDRTVSRTILAVALKKLIDQIISGEISVGASDSKEIKKLSDSFKGEIADYENKVADMEKRISDIESGKTVIQTDISKVTVELRDSNEKLTEENLKLRQELGLLSDDLKAQDEKFSKEMDKESAARKKDKKNATLGILLALIVGVAVN